MDAFQPLLFDNTYTQLPDAFYTRLAPTPLKNARLVSVNAAATELINLDPSAFNLNSSVDRFEVALNV